MLLKDFVYLVMYDDVYLVMYDDVTGSVSDMGGRQVWSSPPDSQHPSQG